jgi:hypothetical protein
LMNFTLSVQDPEEQRVALFCQLLAVEKCALPWQKRVTASCGHAIQSLTSGSGKLRDDNPEYWIRIEGKMGVILNRLMMRLFLRQRHKM